MGMDVYCILEPERTVGLLELESQVVVLSWGLESNPGLLKNSHCSNSPWLFLNRGSGIPEWPQMSYVAKASLELLTLYPLPPECRDFRCVLLCLAPELFLVKVIKLALKC